MTEPDPQAERPRGEDRRRLRQQRLASAMFALSVAGTVAFCVGYLAVPHHLRYGFDQNVVLGIGLAVASGGLCVGLVLLAKAAPPDAEGSQAREPHRSPPAERAAAEQMVRRGTEQLGLHEPSMLRRTLLAALGLLPVPFVLSLRDLGPKPKESLRVNSWKAGDRLIEQATLRPIRVGDLEIGATTTVVPEGATNSHLAVNAESAVILIRLPPGVNRPLPGRANWSVDDLVAYSKICTHAGCPVGLFERRTYNLLCPCHQSTFYVPSGCAVLFGPAARSLPQLPIYADADGYLRASAPFDQPLGPSFWERR
jgi:ubiquinol-cytochrome c reductase iron-sulfur subunit